MLEGHHPAAAVKWPPVHSTLDEVQPSNSVRIVGPVHLHMMP
jgi:hypothetical protein